MNLTIEKLKTIFPDFNRKELTENDFWRICRREKIVVREMPLNVGGYYEFYKGRHYIILNSDLRDWERLQTAFHELFHFYLHTDGRTMFKSKAQSVQEREADALALIAILPFPLLERVSNEDLQDQTFAKLFAARIAVYLDWGV